MSSYAFHVTFPGSFDDAITRVTEELAKEGFGILTEIDVKATLKKKLDLETRPYRILGSCNPHLAHQAISAEPDVGILLPCNVLVREDESGDVVVTFMNPPEVLGITGREDLAHLGDAALQKMRTVRDAIAEG